MARQAARWQDRLGRQVDEARFGRTIEHVRPIPESPMAEERPFLSPQKGEHLPEKTVSAKAMARLQVSADAIAATKKAIQHQGNQVPSLKATNMNSQYRLRVMRDDSCWDYTDAAQQVAYAHHEADVAARADIAHGGNCGEHASLAFHYLRLNAKGQKITKAAKSGLDHAFVIVGDLTADKDNELAVSDPWPNAPTACLWEDHFAFVADRKQIEEDTSMVADGKSFKSAIAAGLKLSARGEQMVKKSETDEETTKKTGDASANHFWNHTNTVGHDDEGNLKKFDYETAKPAIEEAQQGGTTPRQPGR